VKNITDFGAIGDGSTDNQTAFANAVNFCVANGETLYIPAGDFFVGGVVSPPSGPLRIAGEGRDVTAVFGAGASDFLSCNGPTDISGVTVTGFKDAMNVGAAGDISLTDSRVTDCEYLLTGSVDAETFTISRNILSGFSGGLILESTASISGASYFKDNVVTDVARYVYRLQHDAPLFFAGNHIDGVHCDGYSGVYAVARVVMRGSRDTNHITENTIKNVVATDADSVLLYWSGGSAIVTGNTFGKFASGDDCYLVKEKSAACRGLDLSRNIFLGGDESAEFNAVVYLLSDTDVAGAARRVSGNDFQKLTGQCVRLFGQNASAIPGHTIVESNTVIEMDGPCFVGSVNGCRGVTVRNNRCFKHTNKSHIALTGSQRQKSIFTNYSAADYGVASDVTVDGNEWVFSTDGEVSGPYPTAPICYSGLSAAPQNAADIIAKDNILTGADALVACSGSAGSADVLAARNIAKGGLAVGSKSGTTTAQALVTLTEKDNEV